MNLVYGSFCPIHEGNKQCPCRTLTTNASIWTAAELGDVERVKRLVNEKGRRPDSLGPYGYTPLHLAAQNGRLGMVQYLLEAGASPDGIPRERGGCGATPLHRAAFAGQLPCVRALLAAGASPSSADASFLDMKTPLHKAAAQGHADVCLALTEAGANPNACDAAGNTPLDVLNISSGPPQQEVATTPHTPRPPLEGPSQLGLLESSGGGGGEGGGGGNGSEASGVRVLLLDGDEKDWDGVRAALERYGGRPRSDKAAANSGSGDGGSGGAPSTSRTRAVTGVRGVIDSSSSAARGRGCLDVPRIAGRGRKTDLQDADAHGDDDDMCGAEASGTGFPDGAVVVVGDETVVVGAREGAAAAATHEEHRHAHNISSSSASVAGGTDGDNNGGNNTTVVAREEKKTGSDNGGGVESPGIPCVECRLPKVVMVRASCCGGLVCKPCLRSIRGYDLPVTGIIRVSELWQAFQPQGWCCFVPGFDGGGLRGFPTM